MDNKSAYNKEYYERNKEKIQDYYQRNKEYYTQYRKDYYQKNKDKFTEYRIKNRIKINDQRRPLKRIYYAENIDKYKGYRDKRKEEHKEYMEEYREENRLILNTITIIKLGIKRGQMTSPTLIDRTGYDICDYVEKIESLLGEVKSTGWGFKEVRGASRDLRRTLDPQNIQKIPRD